VGLGTFLPVRAEKIEDHKMHKESYYISEETAEKVNRAKKEGRPVLAVGTTSVRTLESAWQGGSVLKGDICLLAILIQAFLSIRGILLSVWTKCLQTFTLQNPL